MILPNPWADLTARPSLDLCWGGLPPGQLGATDGHRIWIATGLTVRERRCTLAHELVHIDLGLVSDVTWAAEQRVRDVTARRLLPDIDAVASALAGGVDMATASDELWVTEDVLTDRLTTLADAERAMLNHIPA
nr:MAG TPA: HTH-type transcriptional regulator [Caudoviricetes sp.]